MPTTTDHRRITSPVKTFAVQVPAAETESATVLSPAVTATQIQASKAYARMYILNTYRWGDDQWFALEQLWTRESGWNHLAVNPSSGATGIPSVVARGQDGHGGCGLEDESPNADPLGRLYIKGRYGDPLGAWITSRGRTGTDPFHPGACLTLLGHGVTAVLCTNTGDVAGRDEPECAAGARIRGPVLSPCRCAR